MFIFIRTFVSMSIMNYKTNTSDYYIHHLYTNYYKNINEALANLLNKVDFKIGTAFGNYQISVDDVFSENGSEDLKYKYVGYGQVAFMGIAVYFKGKTMQDLYYKSAEYKKAIETFENEYFDLAYCPLYRGPRDPGLFNGVV